MPIQPQGVLAHTRIVRPRAMVKLSTTRESRSGLNVAKRASLCRNSPCRFPNKLQGSRYGCQPPKQSPGLQTKKEADSFHVFIFRTSNRSIVFSPVNAVDPTTACRASYNCHLLCNAYIPNSFMSPPPQRRIEDRIRQLCAKAMAATDGDLERALQDLSQLLRGTVKHMRNSAKSLLVEGKPLPEPRRRANDNEV
jgi:hypothetical protein